MKSKSGLTLENSYRISPGYARQRDPDLPFGRDPDLPSGGTSALAAAAAAGLAGQPIASRGDCLWSGTQCGTPTIHLGLAF